MVLTRGKLEGGVPFWAYMCIKTNMAAAFKEAQDRGNFDLEDYGTVLEWGEGENPPAEVQARMQRDYGMRADYEDMLLKAAKLFT